MTTICIIPARGGSKRIPRKNIKKFCGKPMIAYSIDVAKKSKIFDHIIVSTDNIEIADTAKYFGADVPFMRPDNISDDFTGTIDVIAHATRMSEQYYNQKFEHICCLYATSPFVQSQYLQSAYDLLKSSDVDFIIPVTSFPFPIQRAVKIDDNKLIPFSEDDMRKRSQDLDEAYHDAGQFYWGTYKAWTEKKDIWSNNVSPIILPRHLVQDIDTPEDWIQAEMMHHSLSCLLYTSPSPRD